MARGTHAQSLVSIVIPTYNNAGMIRDALDSIMEQTSGSCEVIVVDDGSTDDTEKTVAGYGDKVSYIYQENKGPGSARNRGLETATGDYLVFMDSDDLMLPTKIADQLSILKSNPELDFCHSGWRMVDQDNNLIETVEPWHRTPQVNLEGCLISHPFYLPAVMFTTHSVRNAGGFRSDLPQSEDTDLMLRLLLDGARATWLKKPTVLYRQHPKSLTRRTGERIACANQVFATFFSNENLPADIARQEKKLRYDLLMWSVWELYRNGEREDITEYLQQSMAFFEGTKREILRSWMYRVWRQTDEDKRGNKNYDLKEFLPYCRAAIERAASGQSSGSHGGA